MLQWYGSWKLTLWLMDCIVASNDISSNIRNFKQIMYYQWRLCIIGVCFYWQERTDDWWALYRLECTKSNHAATLPRPGWQPAMGLRQKGTTRHCASLQLLPYAYLITELFYIYFERDVVFMGQSLSAACYGIFSMQDSCLRLQTHTIKAPNERKQKKDVVVECFVLFYLIGQVSAFKNLLQFFC